MKKIKSTFLSILLSLTTICFVTGAALSAANKYTANAITEAKAAELRNAIRNVMPEFDNNPVDEQRKVAVMSGDSLVLYVARKEGRVVGVAVESFSKNGFSGLIRIMVGFNNEGKLYNYSVLEHKETPGLGSRMKQWFRENKNRQNIVGRDMTKGTLKSTKDGGDIDIITAATISTRAFLEAVNLAYFAVSANDVIELPKTK
jgi:electron transport complex protein RnfG